MKNLKQPKKYTHNSLISAEDQQQGQLYPKTKQISKNKKKVINKTNQPSALRLAAINQTFDKIQANTQNLFNNFEIDKPLLQQFLNYNNKVKCNCNHNIKYYCLKCMYKNTQLKFPKVQLPFKFKIIHHYLQNIKKSSILPMGLLSQQIQISTFNLTLNQHKNILQAYQNQQTFILFPHKNSKKVNQIQNINNIKNVVILDCTWFQTDQLVNQLEKQGFDNFIILDDYQSLYWRYNHYSDKALSSAQSLAYFLRQYQTAKGQNVRKYDNIMFLYFLNLKIIENSYKQQHKQINKQQKQKHQSIKQQKEEQNLEKHKQQQ